MNSCAVATPLGTFEIVAEGEAVTAARFADMPLRTPETPVLVEAARQLRAYFAGDLAAFSVPLAPEGSAFQQKVWKALGTLEYGVQTSYGALAKRLGSSARAVGRANATNKICVFIPCHRVIGKDGSLTGYAYGVERKQHLLELEAVHC